MNPREGGAVNPRTRLGVALDIGTALALLASVVVASRAGWRAYVAPVLSARPTAIDDWDAYAPGGHSLGPPGAPVTVTYFGDYECPSCRNWYPRISDIADAFGDTVRVVVRHWPLEYHLSAYPAARAAECAADQGRFAEYHEQLYLQDAWLRENDRFVDIAASVGIDDLEEFTRCVRSPVPVSAIERDIDAVTSLGGIGTPTILVNHIRLNALDEQEIVELIRREALDPS